MANFYAGNDQDFDERSSVGSDTDHDENPHRTIDIRIILVSDRPPPRTLADYIDYHDALNHWMEKSEGIFNSDKTNPIKLDTRTWMYNDKDAPLPTEEELSDTHAVIVAGSMDASDESEEWNEQLRTHIKNIYNEKNQNLQFFGIGYGHQIIAQALLGDVVEVEKKKKSPENWNFGLQKVMLEPEFKAAFPALGEKTSFSCQFLNSDRVVLKDGLELPTGWKIVGKSDPDTIQGLWLHSRVFTFQGLPQFNKHTIENHVRKITKKGAFSAEEVESHLARARANQSGWKEDATLFGRVLYDFLFRHSEFRDHSS